VGEHADPQGQGPADRHPPDGGAAAERVVAVVIHHEIVGVPHVLEATLHVRTQVHQRDLALLETPAVVVHRDLPTSADGRYLRPLTTLTTPTDTDAGESRAGVHAWLRCQSDRPTYFVSRYSSMPSQPPSRPRPDSFTPPKGAAGLEITPELRPTIPVCNPSATRTASEMS